MAISNQVNITATIPPGYALQDYLCNGPHESNITVVLGDGEYRLSSASLCSISDADIIAITGQSTENTTVRCEGVGTVISLIKTQLLIMERITFINCGIHLVSIENILITMCTFKNSSNRAIFSASSNNTYIANCTFQNNGATNEYGGIGGGGGVSLYFSTGDVRITNCSFENNSATNDYGTRGIVGGGLDVFFESSSGHVGKVGSTCNVSITNCTLYKNIFEGGGGGGAVMLYGSTGNFIITNCTFQNNSATNDFDGGGGGGGVLLYNSTGDIIITNCTFQNNSATNNFDSSGGGGGGVLLYYSTGDVIITNCTFQNNSAAFDLCVSDGGGGGVLLYHSTGDVIITNCTFQNNSAAFDLCVSDGGGGGVLLYHSTGDVIITNCTFQNNSAAFDLCVSDGSASGGGGVLLYESTGDVSFNNCTFQTNIATCNNCAIGGGGGISLLRLPGEVSIINCTFQNNIADYGGGGGVLLYKSTGYVNITNCAFESNSVTKSFGGGGILLYGSRNNISITNCKFQNNSATNVTGEDDGAGVGGAGVSFYKSTGNVTITNCSFLNNIAANIYYYNGVFGKDIETGGSSSASPRVVFDGGDGGGGGAVLLHFTEGYVIITYCIFQNNSATNNNDGGGGAVLCYESKGNVSITNCTFQNNSATNYYDGGGGGGAVLLRKSRSHVSITNCTFQMNSATNDYGGGGVLSSISAGIISITNCTFQNNIAFFGGAILIITNSSIFISGSTFTKNLAVGGAALFATNNIIAIFNKYPQILIQDVESLGHLILQDVIVEDNHCSCNEFNENRGGAIYFNGMKVDIFGNTIPGSQFLFNTPLGAIQGAIGILNLHGNIRLSNNTGENGGAICLYNNVPLYFFEECAVEFFRNIATGFGGAIYIDDGRDKRSQAMSNLNFCAIRLITGDNIFPRYTFDNSIFSITFTDNHAQQSGHAVYATPIHECIHCIQDIHTAIYIPDNCQTLTSYFNITPLPDDLNDIQVLSFPKKMHLCACSDPNLCNVISQYEGKVTTYPGRTVRLNVTSVDDGNNLSPSVVYTLIHTNSNTTPQITLGPRQSAQWIGTECGMIEYQIYGPENASLKLLLSNYPTNFPTVLEVRLLPCEAGFTLMTHSSSTGAMKCDCSLFFTSHGVVCDTSDGTVTRNKTNWIGVYNNTLPALASSCPLDYCNSSIIKLSLSRSGDLCNGERTGILCGHCHGNQSVIFGSSKCQVCSDMWLFTLVMFAVLGILLVAALFFLNLTVTQGTLYGLIFYANIIQVNTSIFFNQSILRPLQVIVSFVNLDLGLPLCFYDGMDDADKAGLQFVYPAYLLILTMTVIVLCHYCLQRSSTTSSRSCLYRFPIIIGERAVGVLSTLIYLSYSKLLRTVIDVFTYSTVHLPTGDIYIWFYDGNVEYLHEKHAVLFVAAMVTCTLFLIPYTLALTFIPIIERYSEHNRLFNYLHKKTNQIKPMNDAHYAPYKGEWRWWLGARLWVVVVMYSLNPVYSSEKPSLLLSIQATMVILFMLVQARIEPFGKSLQKTDERNKRTNFCNQLNNWLDLFYLLNYTVLALSMSYILDKSSDQTQMAVVSVGVLVGLYVVVLMVTVLYHLIVAILKACKMYDRAREKIIGLFERKYVLMVPTVLDDPTTSTTTVTVNYGLREPLCED